MPIYLILAGDPLRFLGSGYPPRQMLAARKGGDWGSSGTMGGLCTRCAANDFAKQRMGALR